VVVGRRTRAGVINRRDLLELQPLGQREVEALQAKQISFAGVLREVRDPHSTQRDWESQLHGRKPPGKEESGPNFIGLANASVMRMNCDNQTISRDSEANVTESTNETHSSPSV
jgi:hypothetical protein